MFEGERFLLRLLPAFRRLKSYTPGSRLTVADVLEQQAARQAGRTFIAYDDRRVSYAEHNAEANRVADWARGLGLERGDVVALLMENRPEYLSRWMGLSKLGVVAALMNTHISGRTLQAALATSGARHLILGSECADSFASVAEELETPLEVWFDEEPGTTVGRPEGAQDLVVALRERSTTNPAASVRDGMRSGDELLYIYTSGTTGLPKAARFSHLRFLYVGAFSVWAQRTRPEDVQYCALPLYHTAGGVIQVATALQGGATLALARRFSASGFWDDVRKYEATCFQYIGEFCRYLLSQPPSARDREHKLRLAIGNGLRPDIWGEFQERFGIRQILEFYGATEGNVTLVNFENKPGSVGRIPSRLLRPMLSNAGLVHFDVETESHPRGGDGLCVPCAPGEVGELLGKIPSKEITQGRFEGYTSAEATEQKILRDVFKEGDAWFRTGDLLRQDAKGFYYFMDRIGDTFRWKGENVSTQEVAEVLSGFPGLDLINVYGVEVLGADGRAGMLAYVPQGDAVFDGVAFHTFVSEQLPSYAAPVFVRVLPEPDVTGTFKLRKVDLQREGFDVTQISDPLWVRDDAAQAYVPLTAERAGEIAAGQRRL